MGGMTFLFFLISLSFYALLFVGIYKTYQNKKITPFLIGLVFSVIVGLSLKYSLQIPRPSYEHLGLSKWDNYGFPSMHSLLSFYAGSYLGLWGVLWAGLIALSRVVLKVHNVLDVIVGSLLGLFLFYAFSNSTFESINKREVVRKIIHFVVAFSLFLGIYFLSLFEFVVFAISLFFLYAFALYLPTRRLYEYVKRKEKDLGAVYLISGILFAYLLFGRDVALIVSIVMAVGDSLSPLISMLLKSSEKKRCWKSSMLSSLLVFSALSYLYDPFVALFASFTFGVIDYFNKKLEDNILIPLMVGIIMVLII